MSGYGRYTLDSWGRRRPSYSAAVGDRSLTEHDFEYLGPDYLERSRPQYHDYRPSIPRGQDYYDEESPDVILIRNMNTQYELKFRPFSISDGLLRIRDIRRYAAEKLGAQDPSRLRLLYKGKQLKDDGRTAKDYGLKQQSEIMVVVSVTPPSQPNSDSGTEESGSALSHSSKKKGKRSRRKSKHKSSAGHLAPLPDGRGASSTQGSGRESRAPSPNPPPPSLRSPPLHSPPSQSVTPHSPPAQSAPLQSPPLQSPSLQSPRFEGARGKVDHLTSLFHTKWVPECVQFLVNTPSDAKVREQEHKKLSESILAQVMMKADAIELEGDTQARADRKKLLSEVNDMFKKLDAAAKDQGS